MLKSLFTMFALATATQAVASYDWSPFEDSPNDYFDFGLELDADAFYTTTYEGGP